MRSGDGRFSGDGYLNPGSNAIQEIHGMGADYLLTTNEDELCEYLVTKYQSQLPLSGNAKQEFQQSHRLLADTIRQNVVKRKANFFSGLPKNREDAPRRKSA